MKRAASFLVAAMLGGASASGQSITTEASITAGHSSEENVSAAATQLRVFGEVPSGIRFFVEGAWANTSDANVDAFGTAYPYRDRIQLIEAYGERTFLPARGVFGVKAGRFRPPFGISSGSDQGYTGFLRAPLMRYDGYFALSNDFLEQGVDVVAGVPRFTVETSVGAPGDVGNAARRSGVDTVVRAQSYVGPLIVGASYIRTLPYQDPRFSKGHAEFTGVDFRWMRSGVQVRGEWLTGQPFDGTSTTGWYVDTLVHHVGMGPVTAVARVEGLAYDTAPPFDLHARRQTVGARIRIVQELALQLNLTHQSGGAAKFTSHALDVGVTYSIRRR
jgi:hypothetical protein